MRFEDVLCNGRLWAVVYDGDDTDVLSREKAKGKRTSAHASWLRLYAIILDPNIYLITGGAIILTPTMQERTHTIRELQNLEKVRNYLIDNGVVDADGIKDL